MQKQLVDKLALKMLEGEFGEGDRVRVDAADGELSLRAARRSDPDLLRVQGVPASQFEPELPT